MTTEKYNPQIGLVEVRAFPIFDDPGDVVMVAEYIRNITEQKRAEEEVRMAHKLESLPLIDFSRPAIHNVQQIYESIPRELRFIQTPGEIQEAYNHAWNWFTARKGLLPEIYRQQRKEAGDISVVLLGRPYVIMDPVLNKNIPQKFNELGIRTFFQDMLPHAEVGADSPGSDFIGMTARPGARMNPWPRICTTSRVPARNKGHTNGGS